MKRGMDLLIAAAALLLLAPVLLATAVAVLLDSGRPVLFVQQRVGRGGRVFGMFKFRSMVHEAQVSGPYFTQPGDARITRIGRFIRRTSLDELPQLLNVLRGDMSLVGPRPDLPVQRAHYSDSDWALRCSMRPGITGLAQALLRSEATPQERLALDLRYVRERDLWLDLRILAWTLARATGRGSN
jgi:lipopolysaccharide/colanic/teichoic acid biosynthesis glycosyltransferase